MYRTYLFLAALMIAAAVSTAAAQQVRTPEKGSPERKAILDALRVPVEKDLRQQIVFSVSDMRVAGNWAFVGGAPQRPDGSSPDYSKTKYAEAEGSGAFDNNIFALLRKSAGKWTVRTFAIGCTDVCYADWWSRYKAPKAVFPYTE